MRTTKEERAKWTHPDAWASGPAAKVRIVALCQDVDMLVRVLGITESAMDQLNGDTGTKSRPCSFCRAEVYNAEVGIEHSPSRPELGDGGCPILVARAVLGEDV